MTRAKVTMRDVALKAGVSTASVSYAYTQPTRLTPETLARIQASARDLGYVRDWSARALRRGRTDTVGLVLPQSVDDAFENSYYPRFVQGVGQVCREHGLMLLLVPPSDALGTGAVAEAAADGFIVVGLVGERDEVVSLRARQAPIVLVDGDPVEGIPLVAVDERAAMADLAGRLLSLGHRQLGIAAIETGEPAGPESWAGPMRHRWDGVSDAIAAANLASGAVTIDVVEVPSSEQGGLAAFERLWKDTSGPTVILAFSDEIALGVMAAARAAGVGVPAQLSVTGFDDVDAASRAVPSLTTVRQPITQKGNLAASLLVRLMAGEDVDGATVMPAAVVERESVAAPARN